MHRLPVDRLTLKGGIIATAGFRLTDVQLHAEDWGRPAYRFQLAGQVAYSGGSLPFQLEIQGSTPSGPSNFGPTTLQKDRGGDAPLQVAAQLRLERGSLALLLSPRESSIDQENRDREGVITGIAKAVLKINRQEASGPNRERPRP